MQFTSYWKARGDKIKLLSYQILDLVYAWVLFVEHPKPNTGYNVVKNFLTFIHTIWDIIAIESYESKNIIDHSHNSTLDTETISAAENMECLGDSQEEIVIN